MIHSFGDHDGRDRLEIVSLFCRGSSIFTPVFVNSIIVLICVDGWAVADH